MTEIGSYAFDYCNGLTSAVIGNGVISVGNYAFQNCSQLESVTISSSAQSIGNGAFANCNTLTSVTMLSTTPPTLGTNVFPAQVTEIIVPFGCVEEYMLNWSDYASIIVEAAE